MGFDLVLISTGANGLKVPLGVKCCICAKLLDDGVSLSGCGHNACYECMRQHSSRRTRTTSSGSQLVNAKCPLDGKPYNPTKCHYLSEEVENWLYECRLMCRWFDGHRCTATRVALHNIARHESCCPNRPTDRVVREQRLRRKPRRRSVGVEPRIGSRMDTKYRRIEPTVNAKRPQSNRKDGQQSTEIPESLANPAVRPAVKYNTKKIEDWIKDMSISDDKMNKIVEQKSCDNTGGDRPTSAHTCVH